MFDALRSWLVLENRCSAPLSSALAALRSGATASFAAGDSVGVDETELRIRLECLTERLAEWISIEPGRGTGEHAGLVLRFSQSADLKAMRLRLVAGAREAAGVAAAAAAEAAAAAAEVDAAGVTPMVS